MNIISEKAARFLEAHGMAPSAIDPVKEAKAMAADMHAGLAGTASDMLMIPTYLSPEGELPKGREVAVIDAGGTNFRSAIAAYNGNSCVIFDKEQIKMPGIEQPATWEEFISFNADAMERFMDRTDAIGYCFSYSADITPEIDGKVNTIDKEVTIRGCEGQLVGASLKAELKRRGYNVNKVVILNDTAACLLGGMASVDRSLYSDFIGQISGTGTNTCCVLPVSSIPKLGRSGSEKMIVNMESGYYSGMPRGEFDIAVDRASQAPGKKLFEKMTAGVYLGPVAKLALTTAVKEGFLSAEAGAYVESLGHFDTATVDAWASGIFGKAELSAEDKDFISDISLALLERSARCMCANLIAIGLVTGSGRSADHPICDCAEGSLVQKSEAYRTALEGCLDEFAAVSLGIYITLQICDGTTLPGAAAAAMLN